MRKACSLFVILFTVALGYSQSGKYWSVVSQEQAARMGDVKNDFADAKQGITFVTLNTSELKAVLATAPQRWSGAQGIVVSIPNVTGSTERFRIFEASNFSPELQAQFPDIRSYAGSGIDDPTAHLRISFAPNGIQSMVLRANRQSEFIEPYTGNHAVYAVFNSADKRANGALPFTCTTKEDHSLERKAASAAKSALSDDQKFRTLRLALSCTGEYGQFHGGTVAGALTAMNATMTRVNGVYEIDLALNLILIANESAIIYTNPSTDPYSPASNIDAWNNELQANLTAVIGSPNYDIGHLFGASGGGGDAGCIGCVCSTGKGSGITSPSNNSPQGDTFDIDFVAHEMGHQLGAFHTFTHNYEGNGSQTEPGSGTTIMAYAGVTVNYDVQQHSDDYFTYTSIRDIQDNLATKSCPVVIDLTNPAFTINAGPNYTIPKGTAFKLTATGAGANPANITYAWEQNDLSTNSTSGANSLAIPNKSSGPLFRSFPPTSSTVRYFPKFRSVLDNELESDWESVYNANSSRTLHFMLTGRDNLAGGGQTNSDEVSVIVRSTSGPFVVTSQASDVAPWAVGSTQTITWDVANTTANNINTSQVNILLSIDGGETFPITLAAATANDGSEDIVVPAGSEGLNCRILVEAVGNIFYAVNAAEFLIGFSLETTCQTYTNSTGFSIPDNVGTYTTQNLSITDAPTNINDINVTVNATHPYVGNLTISVQGQNNQIITLWSQQCTTNDNINVTFSDGAPAVTCASPTTGTYKAVGTINSLISPTSNNGTWRLRARDTAAGNVGSITSWSVELCGQTAVPLPLGVDNFGLSNFVVYPNPNNGSFTVSFNSETNSKIQVMVYDLRGRQVYANDFSNTGVFSGNVNLNNVQKGVYLLNVQDGNRKETRKIVVE